MKNKSKSAKKVADKYTATEVGTLVEQFRGEFKVFGERQEAISKKLDATYDQVAINTEKIVVLEIAAKDTADKFKEIDTKFKQIDTRISFIETAINNLVDKIERLTKSIDELIKTKASREELQSLEKRVSAIEFKLTSIAR